MEGGWRDCGPFPHHCSDACPSLHFFPFPLIFPCEHIQASRTQFDLILGLLSENLGCEVELLATQDWLEFESNMGVKASAARDASTTPTTPITQRPRQVVDTVDSATSLAEDGELFSSFKWVGMRFTMHLENVELQVMDNEDGQSEVPLTRFDLVDSKLSFTGFTDGTPRDLGSDITLYSRVVAAHDVRVQDPNKPNRFTTIFAPMESYADGSDTPQMQLTQRSAPNSMKVSIVMNKARLIVSPEWTAAMLKFLTSRPPSGMRTFYEQHAERIRGRFSRNLNVDLSLASSASTAAAAAAAFPASKGGFELNVSLSVTDPEFVIVHDSTQRDSEAVVLTFCNVLSFRMGQPAHGHTSVSAPPQLGSPRTARRSTTQMIKLENLDLMLEVRKGKEGREIYLRRSLPLFFIASHNFSPGRYCCPEFVRIVSRIPTTC